MQNAYSPNGVTSTQRLVWVGFLYSVWPKELSGLCIYPCPGKEDSHLSHLHGKLNVGMYAVDVLSKHNNKI